jgi:hypothetical protein
MFEPCDRLLQLRSDDSNWFSQQFICKINIRPNVRLSGPDSGCSAGVPLEWLVGVKDSTKRLFLGVPAQTEVHRPPGIRNIFAAIAASDVYECIPAMIKP